MLIDAHYIQLAVLSHSIKFTPEQIQQAATEYSCFDADETSVIQNGFTLGAIDNRYCVFCMGFFLGWLDEDAVFRDLTTPFWLLKSINTPLESEGCNLSRFFTSGDCNDNAVLDRFHAKLSIHQQSERKDAGLGTDIDYHTGRIDSILDRYLMLLKNPEITKEIAHIEQVEKELRELRPTRPWTMPLAKKIHKVKHSKN